MYASATNATTPAMTSAVTVPGSLAIEARSHETLVHSVAGSALWIRKIPAPPVPCHCSLYALTRHTYKVLVADFDT